MILGILPQARFTDAECKIPEGSRLFVYSDGVYEIENDDGDIMEHDDFMKILQEECASKKESPLSSICARLTTLTHGGVFTDDFCLIQVTF